MEVIRVDTSMRSEVETALTNICDRAKRIPHVVGCEAMPTEWDRRHRQIDELLTDLDLIAMIETSA